MRYVIGDIASFAAFASHPDFGADAIQGSITCDRFNLRFASESGAIEIPLIRLWIELDRSRNKRVLFSDPQQPGWLVCTFDAKVMEWRPLMEQTTTRRQLKQLRAAGELRRALIVTLGFAAGFAIVALAASLFMGMMVRSQVAKVPPAWEHKLGDECMRELKHSVRFTDDPRLKAKLDQAVAPLVRSLTTNAADYKFYVIDFPRPNALALPGGYVVVTSDLLDFADRPEEIAGVVAHELAHVQLKHGLRKIVTAAGPYVIFKMFSRDGDGLFGVIGNGSQLLIRQSFSQSLELEADSTGWDMLVRAHIDPRGLTAMLRKLGDIQQASGEESPELPALRSHPATDVRVRCLEAKWERLEDKSGFVDYSQTPPNG